ncbi:MAG: ribose 5-phosphate isomerase B [Eubacteriales bacterium]|nr:ribose 5-phosphate isomerase B [Clostridiales bacterium]MDY5859731.1 ribose 5-phosphate isomerase B [Eubacteriales bacterium]
MNTQKKIIIGSDHAGYEAKLKLIEKLQKNGWSVTDVGCYSTESCDYPVPVHKLCLRIQSGEFPLGILICGTGIGVSIAANKHHGIRAAVCSDTYSAEMTRKHNAANVLCMGARVIGDDKIAEITEVFLSNEPLDEERHQRRLRMISELEDGTFDEQKYE